MVAAYFGKETTHSFELVRDDKCAGESILARAKVVRARAPSI